MTWWRKTSPSDTGSHNIDGWVKLQSIWRKASPADEANSNSSSNPWVIDGWLKIKSAWRLGSIVNGVGLWVKIFSGLNLPTFKSPYPSLFFKWPDGFETTDSPINGSKMFVTRGAWTEEPTEFRLRIQEKSPGGTWSTIYDVDKVYLEYLDSDSEDRFPSNANDSTRPVISKLKTTSGYSFRGVVDGTNESDLSNQYITDPIMPRLDFRVSSFNVYDESADGASFSWSFSPYINSGSIDEFSDIYSQEIIIYDESNNIVYRETVPVGTTNKIISNSAIYPESSYTAEIGVIGKDGYSSGLEPTYEYDTIDFITTGDVPEIEVNPTLTLISGEAACVGSVYRLSSGTWSNNPTGYRYYFDRQNFSGTNILTHPSTTTYTSSTYYDYTILSENAQGIDAYTIAANSKGEADLYAYSTSSIQGPIKLPRPTNVSATVVGSGINISWTPHPSATRYRIYWASSSAYEPGAASSTFDEEKTTSSWTWNTSDPDKNGISPSEGSSYVFFVSQSVGGTIWSSWSSPSSLVTMPSAPVNVSRPVFTLQSGQANKIGSTYRLSSGTWTNNPTQFRYILELNNVSGTEIAYYPSSTGYTTDTYYDHTFNSGTSSSVAGRVIAYNGLTGFAYSSSSIGPITAQTYIVSYNGNEGTPSRTSDEVIVGSSTTLPNATRTNYTFDGWYTAQTGGSYVGTSGSSYTPSSSITLYARWSSIVYNVTWNANGGTVNNNGQSTYVTPVNAGSFVIAPNATRAGYNHVSWRHPAAGDIWYLVSPGNAFYPELTLTMYAVWQLAAPSTPTWVSASTDRTDGIRLTWNAVSGATSYEIWWGSSAPSDSLSTPDYYVGDTTSFTDTDIYLTAGSSRTYYIRARNSTGVSSWSSGITGTKAYTRYTVTWNANGGTGGGTTIENAGSAHTAPSPGTRSGYTFNGYYDRPSGDYLYGPIASGALFTAPSTITMYARWSVAISNATAPTSVSATGGNGTASVSWSGATNATKYRVWWSTGANGNGVDPASSYDAETTSTSVSFNLSNGTTYYFWVSASNSNNVWTSYSSSPRAQATPTAPAPPPPSGTAPGTPSGLSNSYSSGPTWTGSWTASTGTAPITYYWTLYQSLTNGGATTTTASGSTTGTSFTQSMNSANGLWAYFTVYASNAYGNSSSATSGWA